MVNWTIGRRYLEEVRSISGVQVVLTSLEFLDRLDGVDLASIHDLILPLEELKSKVKAFDFLKASWQSRCCSAYLMKQLKLEKSCSDQTAVVLFTSGTEALPKAVPLSHANILSNQRAAMSCVSYAQGDAFYSFLPPFHSLGFTVTGLLPLLVGGKVLYSPDPTDAAQMARDIEQFRPTIVCSAPTFLRSLFSIANSSQLNSLRLIVCGAEKAPAELFDQVGKLIPQAQLLEGYGITECSPILTLNRLGQKAKGVGYPLPGVELLIVHPQTHEIVATGKVGLILARGANVFHGYLGKTTKDPFVYIEGKPWYDTGDLGSLDAQGALSLAGRLKRFVKIGAEMVSLPSLEKALEHSAQDQQWAAASKERQLAVVAIQRKAERPLLILFTNFDVSLEEANNSLKSSGISNLARLSQVFRLPSLPLMGTGKIDYRFLEEYYMSTLQKEEGQAQS